MYYIYNKVWIPGLPRSGGNANRNGRSSGSRPRTNAFPTCPPKGGQWLRVRSDKRPHTAAGLSGIPTRFPLCHTRVNQLRLQTYIKKSRNRPKRTVIFSNQQKAAPLGRTCGYEPATSINVNHAGGGRGRRHPCRYRLQLNQGRRVGESHRAPYR